MVLIYFVRNINASSFFKEFARRDVLHCFKSMKKKSENELAIIVVISNISIFFWFSLSGSVKKMQQQEFESRE